MLAFDFFFVPPYLTFSVADTQYLFTFAAMLGVGILISTIADRLRRQNEQMRRREDRLRTLYQLSRELSETPEPQRLLETAQQRLEEFYRVPVALITRGDASALEIAAGDPPRFAFDENERAVALWVWTTRRSPAPERTRSEGHGDSTSRCGARSPQSGCSASCRERDRPCPTPSRSGCSRPSRASSAARSRARG